MSQEKLLLTNMYGTFFMHPIRPWLLSLNIHSVNYDSLLTIVNILSRNGKALLRHTYLDSFFFGARRH